MKEKIKELTGKTIRLWWNNDGWYFNDMVGLIGEIRELEFDLKLNGDMIFKVKYKNVTDFKLI